jgi:PKD repeat protein
MQARLTCLVACLAVLSLPACQEDTPSAAALSATCEARPSAGPAPLTVAFLLTVAGAEGPVSVAISYGDGQSGTNPDATHTYANGGSYTASMTVTTSTQSARCSAAVAVSGSPAPQAGGNKEPNGVFKTTPTAVRATITGQAPLTVAFNMCASSDPEGDELYFLMDFDGDGKFDFGGITGFHCRADRVYALGTWTPTICLYDRDANRKALHDDLCQKFTVVATP